MANESSSDDFNSSPKAITIPEGEYAKYLANLAGEIAAEKSKKHATLLQSGIALMVSVFAFLGYSNLSSMKGELKDFLDTRVNKQLPTEVDQYISGHKAQIFSSTFSQFQSETDSKMALYQLVLLSKELADPNRDGFTNEERDLAIALVKEVLKTPSVVDKPQFARSLGEVFQAFAAADLQQYVDDLDDTLGEIGLNSRKLVIAMTLHYGMRIVGSAEVSDVLVRRFHKFAAASERHKNPELAILWRALYAFRNAKGPNYATQTLLKDASFLSLEDMESFIRQLNRVANFEGVTATSSRVAATANDMVKEYHSEIDRIKEKILLEKMKKQ